MEDEKKITLSKFMPAGEVDKYLQKFIDQGYFFAGLETADQPEEVVYILRLPGKKD